jgi:hypothetical protein
MGQDNEYKYKKMKGDAREEALTSHHDLAPEAKFPIRPTNEADGAKPNYKTNNTHVSALSINIGHFLGQQTTSQPSRFHRKSSMDGNILSRTELTRKV